jgi:tellurite resistance protein TerC
MSVDQVTYLVFGLVMLFALIFDLGLMSKRNETITIKKALYQTLFWVGLSVGFCIFLLFEKNSIVATKYFTAYLMEWSLSIDNIFVFILIFTFFKVKESDAGRALLIGILLAIVFRIIFIAIGIELIDRFHWLLYVFGAFLLYTGIHLFFKKEDEEYNPAESKIYMYSRRIFRITNVEAKGRFVIKVADQYFFTSLSLVVIMLAVTDIVFALDSIPTVVSLVREKADVPFSGDDKLVIYSSNIFAVLGLRSLFFLLRGAVDKFDYLQQGIAIVLVFIGVKMLIEFFNIHISIFVSLGFILLCLGGSMVYSILVNRRKHKAVTVDNAAKPDKNSL